MTSVLNQLRHDLELLKASVQVRKQARRNWIEQLMTDECTSQLPTDMSAIFNAGSIGVYADKGGPGMTRETGHPDKAH